MHPLTTTLVVAAVLGLGVWLYSVLERVAARLLSGAPPNGNLLLGPFRRAASLALQQRNRTERPDAPAWLLAPALYLALAATALTLVPWSSAGPPADVPAGIVLWGSIEALAMVAVFLHGWSANAPLPLLGGYRFVALALSVMLVSMFVLIATSLPAESLRIGAIVESQRHLWNVVRQPLGLPLFVLVGLGVTFSGPLDFADSADLAGGTGAEVSGISLLVWEVARRAMLVSFAAFSATLFLGGWQGPLLPAPAWVALKTVAVLAIFAGVARVGARIRTERAIRGIWTILLPISFLALAAAGLEALP